MLKNKYFIIIMAVVAVGLASLELNQWTKRRAIENEIQSLSQESQRINEKNKDLSDSIAYLQTTAAKEKTMRQQLNMKKEGEIAISFAPLNEVEPQGESQTIEKNNNFIKWWNYFFSEK